MKNLISLLLGIFLSVNIAFAQNSPIYKLNEGKSKHTQLLHAFLSSNQASFKQTTTLNNGIKSIVYQSMTDEEWINFHRELFTYDEPNRSYEKFTQLYYTDSWNDFMKAEFFFNTNGFPEEYRDYEYIETEFVESSSAKFYYAANNKIDSVVNIENYDGVLYKEKTIFNYITEDSVNILEEIYQGGELTETFTGSVVQRDNSLIITYQYDRETYYGIDIYNTIKNSYNSFDFQSYLYEILDDSSMQWVPLERINFTKVNGKPISSQFDYYYEGTWVLNSKSTFIYENDFLVSVVDSSYYDEFVDIYRRLYTYAEAVSLEEELDEVNFSLNQNYPNPFNPITTIPYTLSNTQKVTLDVYNMLGQKVAQLVNGVKPRGNHTVSFDASNLTTGIYLYRLQAGEKTSTRKLLLIK